MTTRVDITSKHLSQKDHASANKEKKNCPRKESIYFALVFQSMLCH